MRNNEGKKGRTTEENTERGGGREKLRKTLRKYERWGREKYREDKTCGMAILDKMGPS